MDDQQESESTIVESVSEDRSTGERMRLLLIAASIGFLVIVMALGGFSFLTKDDVPEGGLVFVIPAGAADSLEDPGIDTAIDIPTEITFGPGEIARITIRNEDSVMNRAGPWLIDAGETFTVGFDKPGTYQFDCTVDPAESVTVTVTEESASRVHSEARWTRRTPGW